jgi:alkyldihydroxyacetonephosphate synthase
MRRWNGWGDEARRMDLPPKGLAFLKERMGDGRPLPDYSLNQYLDRIPKSRFPPHPLIGVDAKLRLDHSQGQSLPDWIGMRGGIFQRFVDGVAQPTTVEQAEELLRFADDHAAIVIPYGGGTSVVGHLEVPETGRPVLSLSLARLNRLLHFDPDCRMATFQAGIRGPDVESHLNPKGFTLGHFPQSFEYATLGGWVATRSSGQQSHHYGSIEQLFAGGEILTPAGRLQLPPFPASAAGPDLRQLVLGSEGRMGVLTKVCARISKIPETDDIYAVFFPSWDLALHGVQELSGSGLPFSMVRLSNPKETMTQLALAGNKRRAAYLIRYLNRYLGLRGLREGETCMCLVGFTGTHRLAHFARHAAFKILHRYKGLSVGKAVGRAWKRNRFRSAYLRNTLWDSGYAVDTLETAVRWDKVASTLTSIEHRLKDIADQKGERIHLFSHLSHVYPTGSSIYLTLVFRLAKTPQETLLNWKAFKHAASRAVVDAGGTISHQHGIGLEHKYYLEAEKGIVGIHVLKKLLDGLDPDRRMNPGKLVS